MTYSGTLSSRSAGGVGGVAAMERAGDVPAASEVYVIEEAVVLPLQKCVCDHRQEQMPYISYVTAILLMDVIDIIAIMNIIVSI